MPHIAQAAKPQTLVPALPHNTSTAAGVPKGHSRLDFAWHAWQVSDNALDLLGSLLTVTLPPPAGRLVVLQLLRQVERQAQAVQRMQEGAV